MGHKADSAVKVLHKAGHRATRGKIAVLRTLMREKRHLSIKQLSKKLGSIRLNESTLYRVLDTLVASGLVRKIHLHTSNASYYECGDTHHHHHVVCTECNVVEEFSDANCERIIENAARNLRSFKMLSGHSIELSGLCNSCARHGAASKHA